jgi:hypothetical protein
MLGGYRRDKEQLDMLAFFYTLKIQWLRKYLSNKERNVILTRSESQWNFPLQHQCQQQRLLRVRHFGVKATR